MKTLITASAIATLIMTSGCDIIEQDQNEEIILFQSESLSINIPIGENNTDFRSVASSAIVNVFNDDVLISTTELTISDESISGIVGNLPAGKNLLFTLDVMDSEGNVSYTGSATADIINGQTVEVSITLTATTGTAIINGTIYEDGTESEIINIIQGTERIDETFIATSSDPMFPSEWANLNYGACGWMQVGYYDSGSYMRGLISFDLSNDDLSEMTSASLELTTRFWMEKHFTGEVTIELYPMNIDWNEGRSGYHSNHTVRDGKMNSDNVNGATAQESSFGIPWKTPFIGIGTEAGLQPIASDIHSPQDGEEVVWEFDLTEYITAEQAKNGFVIVLKESEAPNGGFYDYPVFHTSESEFAEESGPRLIIR